MTSIWSKLTISLYLDEKYTQDSVEVMDFKKDINEKLPNIKYTYLNKEEALKLMEKRDSVLVKIIESENPLPETIILSDIKLNQYEYLNSIVENKLFILSNMKEWNENYFSNYTTQYERIRKIITILNMLKIGLYVIIWIFVFSIAVITYSIIWNFVYYFRNEIAITRLVWWSKLFIYWPFSLQWIIYSVLAFIFSLLIFLLFIKNLEFIFFSYSSSDFLLKNKDYVFMSELLMFIFIWGFSWFLSSRRYLK